MKITTDDSIPLNRKRIRYLVLILASIIIWSFNVYSFFELKKAIEAPIIIKETKTIKIEIIKEIERPIPLILSEILDKVFTLESSRGLHDSCQRQGKYNGYGYNQNKTCFDTQEEARQVVGKWFEKHLTTKSLSTSLCYYQSGKIMNDCRYYQEFKNI